MQLQYKVVLLLSIYGASVTGDCTSQSCLNDLYNRGVVYAEHVKRPLGSSGGSLVKSLFPHEGVVVTDTQGSRWLIHKGSDFADPGSPSTVITDANYLSNKWSTIDGGTVSGHSVDDFMKAGGVNEEYSVLGKNCQAAADEMMKLTNKHGK